MNSFLLSARKKINKNIIFIFAIVLFPHNTLLPQEEPYFYHGKDYGSEAMYNPINVILNGSFDILQLDEKERKISKLRVGSGFNNVFKNLGDPFSTISRYGWPEFTRNELLPIEFRKQYAQWWPNYELHLVGGGMTYTALKEWYQQHNFPVPALMSMTTVAFYELLNEAVENQAYKGDNADPISDVYVFDIGGIILFSFDGVNKFFKEELNMADWSLQPSLGVTDMSIRNNGQYFSVKWKIPFSEQWYLFHYFGMNGLGGLSYKQADGSAYSVGVGMRGKNLYVVDKARDLLSLNLTWNIGFFYDVNNSLLASVMASGQNRNMLNINIYPGLIKIGKFSPGLWGAFEKDGNVTLGVSTIYAPGVGF
jgi:hypothetical protein